ncbi:aspartyl-phosphate phosphatase Spo0E family protein [Bacillus sp. FJAT-27445]|uniref:aspartyl-phosphate phosphatase Spo0E family protein n=1 Tax=Bacillus sp. FJAT-27445 TaxID=1679166 RepID=UPI000743C2BC|nr:aspartyl-phosphate phosphatase Spo0E family protein [Bacillus sp. FJAT-27445]
MFINSFEMIKLLEEIQKKRKVMIELANKNGLTSEMTIQCSQELDDIIVAYQKATQSCRERSNQVDIVLSKWRLARKNIGDRQAGNSGIFKNVVGC